MIGGRLHQHRPAGETAVGARSASAGTKGPPAPEGGGAGQGHGGLSADRAAAPRAEPVFPRRARRPPAGLGTADGEDGSPSSATKTPPPSVFAKEDTLSRPVRQEGADEARLRRQAARARHNRHRDLERLLLEGHARLPSEAGIDRVEAALSHFERQGVRRLVLSALLFVFLPSLAAALYLLVWATPLYRAEARFAVERGVSSARLALSGLAGALGSPDGLRDAFMLRDYILSSAMMQRLDTRLGYLDDFGGGRIDPLTRLVTVPALGIDRYHHYRRHVAVTIDVQSGLIGLAVEAPSAARAAEAARTILELAADELNRLSDEIYRDQMARMEAERDVAERALKAARRDLLALQISRRELDPRETAAAIYARMREIDGRLDDLARQRDVARMAGRPDNPALRRIGAEIAVLHRQRRALETRLAGRREKGAPLNETLAAFDAAEARLALARQRWESVLASLEEARRAALADRRYLVVVAPPRAPPFPERLAAIRLSLFVFLALLVLFLLGRVFLAALRMRLQSATVL